MWIRMTDQTFNTSSRESGRTEWFQRDCFFPHVFNISKFPPHFFPLPVFGSVLYNILLPFCLDKPSFSVGGAPLSHLETEIPSSTNLLNYLMPWPTPLASSPQPIGRCWAWPVINVNSAQEGSYNRHGLHPHVIKDEGGTRVSLSLHSLSKRGLGRHTCICHFFLQVLPKRNLRKMYPRKSVWLWAQRKSSPNFTSPKQMRSPRGRIVTPLNSLRNHNPNTFFSLWLWPTIYLCHLMTYNNSILLSAWVDGLKR